MTIHISILFERLRKLFIKITSFDNLIYAIIQLGESLNFSHFVSQKILNKREISQDKKYFVDENQSQ